MKLDNVRWSDKTYEDELADSHLLEPNLTQENITKMMNTYILNYSSKIEPTTKIEEIRDDMSSLIGKEIDKNTLVCVN